MKNQKNGSRLSVGSMSLFMLALLVIVGLIKHEPWNTQAYAAAAAWVKENPQLTVVERAGNFSRTLSRPDRVDTLQRENFEALVPQGVELQVETADRCWLYYPVSPTGVIGTWLNPTPPPKAPKFVTVFHSEYRVSPDKIESVYTTRVVRWWLPAIAAPVLLCLGVWLRRF